MKARIFIGVLWGFFLGLTFSMTTARAADTVKIIEKNHSVQDVITAFNNLTSQGEWLGYNIGTQYAGTDKKFFLFPEPFAAHIQGMARSPRTGRKPVFYLTVSTVPGEAKDSHAGLMVVEMGTLPTNGERLGSNRLEKGEDTMYSYPSREDIVVKFIKSHTHHPSGISMVGDILAIPGAFCAPGDRLDCIEGGQIIFFDCRNPLEPKELKYKLPLIDDKGKSTGAQGVAITKLPDGRFLLLTNSGSSRGGAHFYRSSKKSFFNTDGSEATDIFHESLPEDDAPIEWDDSNSVRRKHGEDGKDGEFHYRRHRVMSSQYVFLDDQYLKSGDRKGFWPYKSTAPYGSRVIQNLNFVNQSDADGNNKLFLIGACNSNEWSPKQDYYGRDELFLLEVIIGGSEALWVDLKGIKNPETGRKYTQKTTRSPGVKHDGSERYSNTYVSSAKEYTKRWQANFNAGAAAYVSPSGELLYYGASHWADGAVSRNAAHDQSGRAGKLHDDDFGKMAEYGNKYVSTAEPADPEDLPGCCGPKFRENHLGGPYEIYETSDGLILNGQVLMIEPWVRMYNGGNYNGASVMMDWRNNTVMVDEENGVTGEEKDDYSKFSDLDGEYGEMKNVPFISANNKQRYNGFNNCASSLLWCGPSGAKLYLYKKDVYKGDVLELTGDEKVKGVILSKVGFNDNISSARFDWVPPSINYQWTMDETEKGNLVPAPQSPYLATYYPGIGCYSTTVYLDVMGESKSADIQVLNVPPTIESLDITPAPDRFEGEEIKLNGKWTDRADCTVTIDWGDNTETDELPDMTEQTFSFTHHYADNGNYTIEVCVDDGERAELCGNNGDGITCESREITVFNVAPETSITDLANETGAGIGTDVPVALTWLDVTISAAFSDQGTLDTHTANINWADGSNTAGVVTEAPFGPPGDPAGMHGTAVGSHAYVAPGTYDISFNVIDDDKGEHAHNIEIKVVTPEDALDIIIDELIPLADNNSDIASALHKLRGNNGARDKLQKGILNPALEKIKQALQYLQATDSAVDLRHTMALLTLTAKSVAVEAIHQAESVSVKPRDLEKIAEARLAVEEGDLLLAEPDYSGAAEKYQIACRKL